MKNRYIKYTAFVLAFCVFALLSSGSFAQVPAPPQKNPIALTGGTIHPVSGPVINNGTIVFEKGKITQIGSNVDIPSGVTRIDVSGKHIYPGFIETISNFGLSEIGAVKATRDNAEMGTFTPNVRAEVAINAESEHILVNRANGIAMAVSSPSSGILSGKSALIMTDGWNWEDMTYKAPLSMIMNWPRMSVFNAWWMTQTEAQQRKAIKQNIDRVNKFFKDARAYYLAKASGKNNTGSFQKTDIVLESMIPVLKGELPLWIATRGLKEMEAAIEFAEREKLKIVLSGATAAPYIIEMLKEKGIPLIVTGTLRMPFRRDADYDDAFTLPKKLYDAGVKFCIAGPGPGGNRNLPYNAAMAAAFGLPKDIALKAITQYPAEILGVADKVGTLEKGKDATFIITSGDPLEITTRMENLYIQGKDIDLNNRQMRLYKKYQEKYRQLKAQ